MLAIVCPIDELSLKIKSHCLVKFVYIGCFGEFRKWNRKRNRQSITIYQPNGFQNLKTVLKNFVIKCIGKMSKT